VKRSTRLPLPYVFRRRLLPLHASIVLLDGRIARAIDARLFVANSVGDPPGLLFRALANGDFSRLHGLPGNIDMVRAHGNIEAMLSL